MGAQNNDFSAVSQIDLTRALFHLRRRLSRLRSYWIWLGLVILVKNHADRRGWRKQKRITPLEICTITQIYDSQIQYLFYYSFKIHSYCLPRSMLSSFSPNCLGYKMIFGLSKIVVVICIFYIAVLTRSKAIVSYFTTLNCSRSLLLRYGKIDLRANQLRFHNTYYRGNI